MSWWGVIKMSSDIAWIIDQLEDNIIIELQGLYGGNVVDIILEIPINPDFIEHVKDKYKIDFLEDISNLPGRKKYKIEAIGG